MLNALRAAARALTLGEIKASLPTDYPIDTDGCLAYLISQKAVLVKYRGKRFMIAPPRIGEKNV